MTASSSLPPSAWVTMLVGTSSSPSRSSVLSWRTPSGPAAYTRLSPTLNASTRSAVTTTPAAVVPIVVSAGSRAAAACTSRLHALSASRILSSLSSKGPISASWRATMALATSPPGWPPSPSATATTSGVPSAKNSVCGLSVTVAHSVHGPTTRLSSWWSRTAPMWLNADTATMLRLFPADVVGGAGGGDVGAVPFGPVGQGRQTAAQFPCHIGGGVLHLRRDGGIDRPHQQAIALKVAQRQRQHAAADALDEAL